MYVVNMLK